MFRKILASVLIASMIIPQNVYALQPVAEGATEIIQEEQDDSLAQTDEDTSVQEDDEAPVLQESIEEQGDEVLEEGDYKPAADDSLDVNEVNEGNGEITFSGGTGTESDPYLIGFVDDLIDMYRYNYGNNTVYFKQTSNITVNSDITNPVHKLKPCPGNGHVYYDGNNCQIKNLYIEGSEGLITTLSGSQTLGLTFIQNAYSIKNLTINGAKIYCPDITPTTTTGSKTMYMSAMVGKATSVENCHLKGNIQLKNECTYFPAPNIAGMVYEAEEVIDCSVDADITLENVRVDNNDTYFAGMVYGVQRLKDCTVHGNITASAKKIAGIAVNNSYTVSSISEKKVYDCSTKEGTIITNTYDSGSSSSSVFQGGAYGIIVNATNPVEDCKNYATLSAEDTVAGIAGECHSMTRCINNGELLNAHTRCGIVSGIYTKKNENVVVEMCRNYADVDARSDESSTVCGIARVLNNYKGQGNLTLIDSTNEGNLFGHGVVGIVSYTEGLADVRNCYNFGDITGYNVAGIADSLGESRKSTDNDEDLCNIKECGNEGNIVSDYNAAGIAINAYSSVVEECYNSGDISSKVFAAGIVQQINAGEKTGISTVRGCNNTGRISGEEIGGIIKSVNYGVVEKCFNTGDLIYTGTDYAYIGGVVESITMSSLYADSSSRSVTVEDCYNAGTINWTAAQNNRYVGGIVGTASPDNASIIVKHCYNVGTMSGTAPQNYGYVGAVVGQAPYKGTMTIADCYYLDAGFPGYSGYGTSGMGYVTIARTSAQMKQASTYSGWDFTDTWEMGQGQYLYPVLKDVAGAVYTITLIGNGGLFGTEAEITRTTSGSGRLTTMPRPKRAGKRFAGYYTLATGGDRVTKDYMFAGDTRIYAHWGNYDEEHRVTITPIAPSVGEKNVDAVTKNLKISFETSIPVKGFDLSAGGFKINKVGTGETVFEAKFKRDFKNTKSGSGSRIEFTYLYSGLEQGTEYYIEIEDGFLVFEDEELFAFTEDDWQFKTGSLCWYADEQGFKEDVTLPYTFDIDNVDFERSSYEYNYDLALIAYGMTLSAFESYEGRYGNGAYNAERTFSNFGFEKFECNDGYGTVPNTGSIGVCAAQKPIKVNGEDYTLIAMPIRGAGYEAEWAGNVKVGNGEYHEGFKEAADKVISFLRTYIRNNNVSGKVKIIITGYSRAAGTANIAAALLDDGALSDETGISLERKDIYGYCFEPPAVTTRDNRYVSGEGVYVYDNIYCFINPKDLVPKVPGNYQKWNIKRFGRQLYYPDKAGKSEVYNRLYPEFLSTYNKLSKKCKYNENEFSPTCGDKTSIRNWTNQLVERFSTEISRDEFVKNIQPIAYDLLKDGLGDNPAKNFYEEFGINNTSDYVEIAVKVITSAVLKANYTHAKNFLKKYAGDKENALIIIGHIIYFVNPIFRFSKIALVHSLIEIIEGQGIAPTSRAAIGAASIFNMFNESDNANLLVQEHYPLVNFAWLVTCKGHDFEWDNGEMKYIVVNCPVDVVVRDKETNEVVGKIVDGKAISVDGSPVDSYVDENEQKIFVVPTDRDYVVDVTADDNGKVDYSMLEYYEGVGYTKRTDFLDIEMSKGDKLEGTIENSTYTLKKDDESLASEVQNSIEYLDVELTADGYGNVYGEGSYMKRGYLIVSAVPDPGAEFDGWYDKDGNLVSKDSEYRFRVDEAVSYKAKFKEIDGILITPIEPQTYSGYALKPDVVLHDGIQELTQGIDYTVTYKNNKKAFEFEDEEKLTDAQKKQAPQAIIRMKGNYSGSRVVYFSIAPLSIDDETAFEAYLKKGKNQAVIFKYNDKTLKEKTDYIVNKITGDSVSITGTGNFAETHDFPLAGAEGVTKVSMSKVKVDTIPVQFYTGTALTADTFKAKDGKTPYTIKVSYPKGTVLKEGVDYQISKIINPVRIGTATVVLKGLKAGGKYSFTGEKRVKVRIKPRPISTVTVTGSDGTETLKAVYNKAGAVPEGLTLTVEGKALKQGRDYTVKYSSNTKYSGTGDESGKDGKLTIKGKGNFKGTKKLTFKITRRPFTEEAGIKVVTVDKPQSDKTGDYVTDVRVFDSDGKLLKAGADYEKQLKYTSADGKVLDGASLPKENDVITVTVTGKGGYSADTVSASYRIIKPGENNDISKAKIVIDPLIYKKGKITLAGGNASHVKAVMGSGGKELAFSTDGISGDFMVLPGSYVNNDKKGTAKVTFIGINGYSGYKTVTFKIGTRSLAEWWKGLFK